jgi:hypothetical protein
MIHHALDRHALEPPVPRPSAVVARHRPGLVALIALVVPIAVWTRNPLLVLSGLLLVALLALRIHLAAVETRPGVGLSEVQP